MNRLNSPALYLLHGHKGVAPAPRSESDTDLAASFLRGDREAFATLARRHQLLLYRTLRRFTQNNDDARDLTQRVFQRALEAAPRSFPRLVSTGQENAVRAWFLRIAINLAKNHVRDASRWRTTDLERVSPILASVERLQRDLEAAQMRSTVRRAIGDLTPRQREVFLLRVDGELPFAEIGASLGMSESNAKAQFHHAVKRLKEAVHKIAANEGRHAL